MYDPSVRYTNRISADITLLLAGGRMGQGLGDPITAPRMRVVKANQQIGVLSTKAFKIVRM